jgi:predicted transcriptional regulator
MAQGTDGPEDGPDDVPVSEEKMRRAILVLLVSSGSERPWSLGELEAEVDDASAVQDGVRQLQGLGLVHRCEEFVWPTRAAVAADELLR